MTPSNVSSTTSTPNIPSLLSHLGAGHPASPAHQTIKTRGRRWQNAARLWIGPIRPVALGQCLGHGRASVAWPAGRRRQDKEITAFRALLELLDLGRALVTTDAMA